jgi:hypothetical protein
MRNERAFRCVFPLRRERHRFGLDDAPNGLLNPSLRLSKSWFRVTLLCDKFR